MKNYLIFLKNIGFIYDIIEVKYAIRVYLTSAPADSINECFIIPYIKYPYNLVRNSINITCGVSSSSSGLGDDACVINPDVSGGFTFLFLRGKISRKSFGYLLNIKSPSVSLRWCVEYLLVEFLLVLLGTF